MIRFVYLFNYPLSLPADQGESWFLKKHVLEVKKLPGLLSFNSWPLFNADIQYPSAGASARFDQFVRRCDLGFENMEAWEKAYKKNPEIWTAAKKGEPGFDEFECAYVNDEPQYNIMRDVPPQQYKYMTMQLNWPSGVPKIKDTENINIGTYLFSYNKVTPEVFDDWYLGHHTREIKQVPGVSHYLTWKTLKGFNPSNAFLQPHKYYRMTEVGMSRETQVVCTVNEDTRLRYTWSTLAQREDLVGVWINMSMKFEQVQEFLK